ncbi:MAG: type II toxin-antitoxin system RelE/ParE family toxin [Armatimonadetes bacterium]|nr:type II toxin-antitoxin system RelE/ParE family toxin [Armatimonadota bacterium]
MDGEGNGPAERPVHWVGSARRAMARMPRHVQQVFGAALQEVQLGRMPSIAAPLTGFSDAGVLELAEDYVRDTYRAIYTVRFAEAVYVLHVFKKKSKRGIATPKPDMELVRRRLSDAEADHKRWVEETERRHGG